MNFTKIINEFTTHADKLRHSSDPTARFRASNYLRAVELLESKFNGKEKVNKEKLDSSGLSRHMIDKANDILKGKSLKLVVDKTLNKGRSISRNQTISRSRSVSRSRPVNRSQLVSRSQSVSRSRSVSKSRSMSKSNSQNKELIKELTKYMGIGLERANQLIADGLTNINQLHSKKWIKKLPEETQLFLQLKPSEIIPHEDIAKLEPYLQKLQTAKLKIYLVGSYRRKKPFSRDIDVMIVSESINAIDEFLTKLRKMLKNKAYHYSKGPDKLSVVLDLHDILGKQAVYKLDAFRVLPENQASMLLYSTGSKQFNIAMRGRAKKKGLLLNQNGLFYKDGTKLNLPTERDYFIALGLEYKNPVDRL
jgi:DNA polymerase/3'-5' exonuclease PolX